MTEQRPTYLYPDSNVFLECKDLRNLPWKDVDPGARELVVVLTEPVLREVDRAAYQKERLRERSRQLKALLRPLVAGEDDSMELAKGVTLLLSPRASAEVPADGDTHVDGLILAEALSHQAPKGARKILLTHETVLLLAAREHTGQLDTFPVPDEWLAPRSDDRIRQRVKALEDQVASLSQERPDLSIWFLDQEQERTVLLVIRPALIEPLSDQQLLEVLESELARRRLSELDRTMVSEHRAERYDESLTSYGEDFLQYLERLTKYWAFKEHVGMACLCLTNGGFAPAETLELRIESSAGLRLTRDEQASAPKPPNPPKRPVPTAFLSSTLFESPMQNWPEIHTPHFPKPRDPRSFYWDSSGDPYGIKEAPLVLSCQQFMHGGDIDETWFFIGLDTDVKGGEITAHVSASNLPKRVSAKLGIRVEASSEPPPSTIDRLRKAIEAPTNDED